MLLINIPSASYMKALLAKSNVPTCESERTLPSTCKLPSRYLKIHLEEEMIIFNNKRLILQHNFY